MSSAVLQGRCVLFFQNHIRGLAPPCGCFYFFFFTLAMESCKSMPIWWIWPFSYYWSNAQKWKIKNITSHWIGKWHWTPMASLEVGILLYLRGKNHWHLVDVILITQLLLIVHHWPSWVFHERDLAGRTNASIVKPFKQNVMLSSNLYAQTTL